jgi:hypothetical protein
MGMRRLEMATSMAGERFSYAPGDLVDVDSSVADAWIKAGIAKDPDQLDKLPPDVHTHPPPKFEQAMRAPARNTATRAGKRRGVPA